MIEILLILLDLVADSEVPEDDPERTKSTIGNIR